MWTIIFVLIGVGLAMVLLEIFVIPGGGLAGIIGFGLMVLAVYLAFQYHGTTAGFYTLGAILLINLIALALVLRPKTWDKAMLKTNIDARVNIIDTEKVKVGDQGITISRCTPVGKALIHDEFYEVHARSEFIEEDQPIEVIKIEDNKIFIKLKT
ncbi:MAG: nodulation efficiency protein D (NfeD) [Bacteroidales bacterium]|nr:nodulation efficiency protein D (NfeD) [Bacteroidales bacterium]